MRYPWVNSLLLVFVCVALATGYLGLTNGDPGRAWILVLHGVAAFAIVALAAWKTAVIVRSLRRRGLDGARVAFLGMALVLVFVVVSGLVWSNAGRFVFGRVSLIGLHQWGAALVAGLLVWHVASRLRVLRVPYARDRRAFLRLGVAGAAGGGLWLGTEALARAVGLPGAERRFTGSYERGSFTGRFPAVSWLFDDPERISGDEWRLVIDGRVARPVELDLEGVRALGEVEREVTLDCTGGWYTTQRWGGVPVAALLELAGPDAGAASVDFESVTGFSRRFSMAEARGALLALGVAGQPLTHGHGAPARLVMPDHRGFDWVKWVRRIRVHRSGDIWQLPLPI